MGKRTGLGERLLAALLAMMLGAPAVAAVAPPVVAPPVVATSDGAVRGEAADGLQLFRGIPYAAPPVGAGRWRDPAPPAPWTGVRDARRFAASCYQDEARPFGPYTAEFLIRPPVSEDCLYLNIWAPAARARPRPVLVWIHGGGFASGSGAIPIYDGARLARRGVVVVNFNYRLGVFGFLAHPDLTRESATGTSGNYGLMDMVQALRWVRRNIARFGGDPDNVTIIGQSAGAAAVNELILSEPAKGLFRRAIAESGSGMGLGTLTRVQAEAVGTDLARAAGLARLEDLRRASPQALLAAVHALSSGQLRLMFAPNIDGRVLSADPDSPTAAPVTPVPLLTGYNADEGGLFPAGEMSPEVFEAQVRSRYGAFADRLLALYPHQTRDAATASNRTLIRDRYMASLVIWSEAREASSGQPVYGYLFSHVYPGPQAAIFRSFHSAEVPYVFGALDPAVRPFTATDRAVSDRVQGDWLNFARTGNPNGTAPGPWRRATEAGGQVMGLSETPGPQDAVSTPERLAAFRAYVAQGGRLSLF